MKTIFNLISTWVAVYVLNYGWGSFCLDQGYSIGVLWGGGILIAFFGGKFIFGWLNSDNTKLPDDANS